MFDQTRAMIGRIFTGIRQRRFKAGEMNRYTSDWITSPISTNEELKKSLKKMIDRAEELACSDSDYIKWLEMRAANIIGHAGIRLKMGVKLRDGKSDKPVNLIITDNWKTWGKKRNKYAHIDKGLSWLEIEKLVDRTFANTGDVFIRLIRGANNPFCFSLQVLKSTDIDIDLNVSILANGNRVIMGIELNSQDEETAIYVKNKESSPWAVSGHTRIPASEYIHIFAKNFPEQVRGYPVAAGAILDLNMAGKYKETALVGARVAAAQMGIWEPTSDNKSGGGWDVKNNNASATAPPDNEVVPGKILKGRPGWTFKSFSPTQPIAGFPHFMKVIDRGIANGLGVLYHSLFNDYENVNFSSLRAGAISERDAWKMCQEFFIENLHEQVFAEWLRCFLLSGISNLQMRRYSYYLRDSWQPRRWVWVDPVKDAKAAQIRLHELKTTSRRRLCQEEGVDLNEILDEQEEEMEDMKARGLTPETIDNQITIIENEEEKENETKASKAK